MIKEFDWVMANQRGLTDGARLLLLFFLRYRDYLNSPIPMERLVSMTGISRRSVRRHIADLEAAGVLVVGRRVDEIGRRASNEFSFSDGFIDRVTT